MKDDFYTLHQLVDNLTEYLNLTSEQQFRVTAKIKRLIHHEKHDVYSRYSMYAEGYPPGSPQDPWLHRILTQAADNHKHWASKTDEEIVTWSVGTHIFTQKMPDCTECGNNLASKGYMCVPNKDSYKYYCQECSLKLGIWVDE